ncbi:hypothetical protein ACI797_23220 [Geodermatophilus sp. SYSU D00691]
MPRVSGSSTFVGVLIDWLVDQPAPLARVPVEWMTQEQVAAELQRIDRDRARAAAREAALIARFAEHGPDGDEDHHPPGMRRRPPPEPEPPLAGPGDDPPPF